MTSSRKPSSPSAFALGGLLSTMSSPQKSSSLLPSGSLSPLASGQGTDNSVKSALHEQVQSPSATAISGLPSLASASPTTVAPPPERSIEEKIAAVRQRALAAQARVRQREQIERQHAEQARINEEQRRAEELRQNRKRERSASPTLDLPQKKPALERPNAEGEEAVMDLSMSTFNNLQTSAGQKGDDRATAVPDRSVSKHKNPASGHATHRWYRGDPSLALIFETNLKRRTNGIVSKNKNETNRCVFRWKPWSAAVHLAGSSEPDHVHDIDFFSFRGLPPHVVQDVSEEGLEGTPSVPAWEQYGDVKDVICELASGRKCTLTVSVAQDRRCRDATHMLQKAYARRFQPHYTYPQEAHEPATVLDLRRMDTVMRIGNTLKHFIPSAKTWRDGSAEDTEWTPERLFDLPKHLNSLLRLGVSVIPGETADKVMEKPVQVVEEAEEGSEEGKILG